MSVVVNRRPSWLQFAAWALCGGSAALVLLAAFAWGPLAILPTAAFACLAVLLGGSNVSAIGALAGAGAWGFVLAWLNRDASPWPFALAAVVLVGVAVLVFVQVRRHTQ